MILTSWLSSRKLKCAVAKGKTGGKEGAALVLQCRRQRSALDYMFAHHSGNIESMVQNR